MSNWNEADSFTGYELPMARCEADGGMLRLHRADVDVDVEPLLDRCVIFWSDHRTPHEAPHATVSTSVREYEVSRLCAPRRTLHRSAPQY